MVKAVEIAVFIYVVVESGVKAVEIAGFIPVVVEYIVKSILITLFEIFEDYGEAKVD